jgi:hypothetical protein
MAGPKPSMGPAPAGYDETSAIGEVTVLVFALKPGQSEVRVRYPKDALPGQAGASAKQSHFHQLVLDELQRSLRTFAQRQ